jgi:tetratricopeptide (TPR) repeat protein
LKNIYIALIAFFISLGATAQNWMSPIDAKYLKKDPNSFQKFDEARNFLDSWQGQKEILNNASVLLQSVLDKDDEFAPAHREYGRLMLMSSLINSQNLKADKLALSEKSILKSIEIEPEYADSYVLLGHLYTNMRKYDDAEIALKKADVIGTETPWLDLNWADLLLIQGKNLDAIKRYEKVISSKTPNRKAYLSALSGVTDTYYKMGDLNKVNEWYKKQIAYDSQSAWARGNYAGFLLFNYNDVDGAITYAEQALKIMNYGLGKLTLACAYYTKWAQLKDSIVTSKNAQKYFEMAWEIYPYPEAVIKKTQDYPYTKITAAALEKWLVENENNNIISR